MKFESTGFPGLGIKEKKSRVGLLTGQEWKIGYNFPDLKKIA